MDVKELAKKGGQARWKGKTKKQKSEHGKIMAEAKKVKKAKEPSCVHGTPKQFACPACD